MIATLAGVLAISLALVLLNGLFVCAEFALLGSSKPALEHRASRGDRVARRLHEVVTSPHRQDRYVATAQLGITVASLSLGMFAEHHLAAIVEPWLGRVPYVGAAALASGLALAALTALHIVLGEMVPKGIALQAPERVSRITDLPMQITLILLYPLVEVSGWLARVVLRTVGVRREQNPIEQVYTPEELQIIVDESHRGGALQAEAGRILHELFEFGDLTAAQAMVPRVQVAGIPVGATTDDLRAIILTHRRTRYAVYEDDLDHIVGTVHVKDLLRRLIDGQPIAAADARRVPLVPETASLDDVLATMQRSNTHMAVVIDEHGGTAGLISLEDVFEEVVGELDEGAPAAPPIVDEAGGCARVAGTVRLDELGQHFDLALEHEEVDSVSGLILARLGRPPVPGDTIEYGRLRLEVTAISGKGVKEARACPVSE